MNLESYMAERVDNQVENFDQLARRNQRIYSFLRMATIACNVLTAFAIALTLAAPARYKIYMGLGALVLSMIVLATHQIQEFYKFGSKWEKYRTVAEQIKSEKFLFLNDAGTYRAGDTDSKKRAFIESVEGIIQGTDKSYFALMMEPGEEHETHLQ